MNPVIRKLHEAQLRKDLPEFRAGDTVKVNVRLLEGEGEKVKERIQTFEGVVISKKGRASSASFTVRRVSFGTGVERIFPLHSPSIASIDVVSKGNVRRSRRSRRSCQGVSRYHCRRQILKGTGSALVPFFFSCAFPSLHAV